MSPVNQIPIFGLGGLTFLQPPKLGQWIVSADCAHKFWDLVTQITQIIHKFLAGVSTSISVWGADHVYSPPKTDKLIVSFSSTHKFWE